MIQLIVCFIFCLYCYLGYKELRILQRSILNDKGYPKYRRRKFQDFVIVPHNRKIILHWGGHACLEFSGSTYCVLYLYDYLYKGSKKVQVNFNLTIPNGLNPKDEQGHYIRGRKLNSMECMWRGLGYQTYPATNPKVFTLKVQLQDYVDNFSRLGKLTSMAIYMNRPAQLFDLRYGDFFRQFIVTRKQPSNNETRWFKLTTMSRQYGAEVYIKARKETDRVIVRLNMVMMGMGELYYLRLILMNKPISSCIDAKTVNGMLILFNIIVFVALYNNIVYVM